MRISWIYYFDDKYTSDLFSWYVCYRWVDCCMNMDFQEMDSIQRNEMARDAHQFLNRALNISSRYVCLLYDTSPFWNYYTDTILLTWVYDI